MLQTYAHQNDEHQKTEATTRERALWDVVGARRPIGGSRGSSSRGLITLIIVIAIIWELPRRKLKTGGTSRRDDADCARCGIQLNGKLRSGPSSLDCAVQVAASHQVDSHKPNMDSMSCWRTFGRLSDYAPGPLCRSLAVGLLVAHATTNTSARETRAEDGANRLRRAREGATNCNNATQCHDRRRLAVVWKVSPRSACAKHPS